MTYCELTPNQGDSEIMKDAREPSDKTKTENNEVKYNSGSCVPRSVSVG